MPAHPPVVCKKGHPYVKTVVRVVNRYGEPKGYHRCRTCHDTYMRAYAQRRRAAKKTAALAQVG